MRDANMCTFMHDQIGRKWEDSEFVSNASHALASATLREMSVPEHPAEGVGPDSGQVLRRHAAALLHLTEALAIDAYEGAGATPAAAPGGHTLRLARLWECIAGLEGPSSNGHSLLNAASLYDLAGYQANATCLSRRFDRKYAARASGLAQIVSTLLQRRFVKLRRDCLPLTKEPDYDEVQDMPHALGMAVAAKAVSALGGYFLSGSRAQLDTARRGLVVAERLFAESGLYHESSLMHSVRSMSGPMAQRSTWSILRGANKEGFAWTRYAMLLARGQGPAWAGRGRPVSETWPSQREAVEKGLFDPSRSLIVRMPTSSGKTRIAEMAILDALTSAGGAPGDAKCVYVAPYRALVGEVADSLSGIFADLGYTVSGMDGSYSDGPFDDYAVMYSDILVTTPEKLDLLIRTRRSRLVGTSLFIFDEGHAVGNGRRGLKMELLLTRLAMQFASSRTIVLSATISDESIEEFAQWLCRGRERGGGGAVTSKWSPTIRRRARFEWPAPAGAGGVLVFDEREDDPLSGRTVKEVASRRTYEYVGRETGRTNRERFPPSDKSGSAAELAFKYSEAGPVLVYGTAKESVMSIAGNLDRRISLAGLAGEKVPRHFLADPASTPKSQLVASEWLGGDHEVSRLLARGIAVHHADVPDALKRSIEGDVRAGAYRVIVATDTLSQGVDMPVRTVIIHSSRRYDERADRSVPIPASEYWSLAGRSGRAGHETEGLVIHIVASAADRRDYEQYGRGHGHDRVRSHMHSLLGDLASKRMGGEDLEDMVDPDVLGMLAEESVQGRCEDAAEKILSGTLVAEQMRADEKSSEKMQIALERFRSVARNAARLGGNLSVYAGTGLGSHSCRAISEYVQANSEDVARLVSSAKSDEDVARLVLLALGIVERLPEMSSGHQYDGDRDGLIRRWIAGDRVPDILGAVPPGGRAGAVRFIEKFLGRYMPWGISAFVRIAAAELGIEAGSMPLSVRCVSDMVRYGVPIPEAGWAMRLGVTTRQAAVRVAADYTGERTVRAFAPWLAEIDGRTLARYDGDLAGATLMASRIRPNPLIRGGYSLDRVLRMGANVKCVENGSGPAAAARLSSGDPLDLKRDYDAAYDRNAIGVYADGSLIGHVERDVAGYLAPLIDSGTRIMAGADGVEAGPHGPKFVRIALWADGEPATAG